MKLAARFLTAMAIISLAIIYVATRDQLPDARAATGTIQALNVGTCYATDEDEFKVGDCDDGSDSAYDVAGRKVITEAETLYATYAVDPRTSAENPRAILFNTDLLRISIKDAGRDRRTGVLYGVSGASGRTARLTDLEMWAGTDGDDAVTYDNYKTNLLAAIDEDSLADGLYTPRVQDTDPDMDGDQTQEEDLTLSSGNRHNTAFEVEGNVNGHILESGEVRISLTGRENTLFPIAPINDDEGYGLKLGEVKFFGFLQDYHETNTNLPQLGDLSTEPTDNSGPENTRPFRDISSFLELDEDYGCPTNPTLADPDASCASRPPWLRVAAQVPAGQAITIMYVYYETSDKEVIVGSRSKAQYENDDLGIVDDPDTTENEAANNEFTAEDPGFSSDESASSGPKALLVRVGADGERETRNLWLEETGRFTGTYVGYVRLTDANGNGSEAGETSDDDNQAEQRNWGRQVRNGSDSDIDGAAVIGVESGPVVVTYRDTDDDEQTLTIAIDTSAPTITVDAPAHEDSTRDASPNMSGTFTDTGAGLREDSFKLFADNKDDADEDGDKGTPVFDLEVYGKGDRAAGDRGEVTIGTASTIEIAGSYQGYETGITEQTRDSTFGIVKASDVFLPESGDDSTYNSREDDSLEIDLRKVVSGEDFDDGATSGEFDQSIRFDFASELPNETFNNTIDFQAVVMDRAGNLGFSDSDPTAPRFIHEYGVDPDDRERDKHNVLGWYSRHILFLDLVDPAVQEDESATGFYGRDDDGNIRADNGVMVVFDKPVSDATITNSTFDVTLDDGSDATVDAVRVDGKRVFLQLTEDLAPDATPKVDLASGEVIRDLAGNSTLPREFDEIEVSDGILPTFTVELSNGSGVEPPDYGEDKITKDRITIKISSDESIQGAPKFVVLCENFTWYAEPDSITVNGASVDWDDATAAQRAAWVTANRPTQEEANSVAKYVSNRTGSMTTSMFANVQPVHRDHIDRTRDNCGYTTPEGETNPNPQGINIITSLQRGGNNWEYRWSNVDSLLDGKLTVVVYGRDRGGFEEGANSLVNYGTATASFTFDSTFIAPTADDGSGGEVIPNEDEAVSEPRPFVLIDFSEKTPVDVTKFEIDKVDVLAQVEQLDNNRFVYWPEPLDIGTYTVYVEANDAANNDVEFQYKFTVRDRLPFALNLLAGWNTISFPANPQDRALHAVFTAPEIDQVIGWDATNPDSPWRAATRVDGVWTTGEDYAVLNDVEARYGYWVHSQGFVTQSVKLVGKGDRIGPLFNETTDIPTNTRGWNFVGVVDVDGDQTEDNAQQTLLNSKKAPISAEQYLGDYRNAYTWNNIDNKWQRLRPDGPITIGTGIWVYYDRGGDIAP